MHKSGKAKNNLLLASVAATAILAISTNSYAQETKSSNSEEVIVTARLRKEKLQSVPLSIASFSEKELKNTGANNVQDVAKMTPGFTYSPLFGGAAATPVIRGQSTTIGEPNVGFFIDGVYQSSRVVMDASIGDDVARVEVVKGPQSALYGRNTFGGAINIISKPPSGEFQAQARLDYSSNNTISAHASASGAIIADKLFYRIGAVHNQSDGYFKNTLTGTNLDTKDTNVFSGMLYATPNDTLSMKLRLANEKTRDGDLPLKYATNNSFIFPFSGTLPTAQMYTSELKGSETFSVTPGHNDRDYTTLSATIDKKLDGITLTSVTGFDRLTYDQQQDNDFRPAKISYQHTRQKLSDFSQEIRLSSNKESNLNWIIGAYYYDLKTTTDVNNQYAADALSIINTYGAAGFGAWRFLTGGNYAHVVETTKSKAVFASVGYKLSDKARISLEGRYTDETKTADSVAHAGILNPSVPAATLFNASRNFKNFVPRLTIDYAAKQNLLFYASASKGEKTGGFNTNVINGSPNINERFYDPESAWNYEVGMKSSSDDGRYVFNLAAYQIDWSNQIVRAVSPVSLALLNINAGKTSIKGFEAEFRARPTQNLSLNAGLAFTDSKYDKYYFATLAAIGMNPTLDGTRLQYVSKWQYNLGAQYIVPVANNIKWFSRADLSYQSDQSAVQPAFATVGSATQLNLRTGFDFEKASIRLFVNNATNEKSALSGAFTGDPGQRYDFVRGLLGQSTPVGIAAFEAVVVSRPPRTYGISISLKY